MEETISTDRGHECSVRRESVNGWAMSYIVIVKLPNLSGLST